MVWIKYFSQWLPSTVWLPTFFKIPSFVFSNRNKLIFEWVNDDRTFIFGWTIPLSVSNDEYKKLNQLTLTSMTCFLLDLSLDAHSTEPPRKSTVNSGLDWLPPNLKNKVNKLVLNPVTLQANIKSYLGFSLVQCCLNTSYSDVSGSKASYTAF